MNYESEEERARFSFVRLTVVVRIAVNSSASWINSAILV